LREAREGNRPLLVHVTATSCGYKAAIGSPSGEHETDCEKLERYTIAQPSFADAAARFVPLVLQHAAGTLAGESPAERDAFRRWKVGTVPTLLVSDPWGNEVIRMVGPTPLANAVRVLRAIPEDFAPLRATGEALAREPERLDALLAAATFYQQAGLGPVAERYYERASETPAAKAEAASRRQVVIARGLNRLRMGQAKEAAALFSEEAGRGLDAPQSDAVLFGWAMASFSAGDKKKAREIGQDLARRFPDSPYSKRLAENLAR
jgi:hypothetical protein